MRNVLFEYLPHLGLNQNMINTVCNRKTGSVDDEPIVNTYTGSLK